MTNPISKFLQERRARAIELERLVRFLDSNQNAAHNLSELRAEMERTIPKNPAQGATFREVKHG